MMDDYGEFVLSPIYEQQFNARRDVEEKAQLIKSLQFITAKCVKQGEVIRTRQQLEVKASTKCYSANIEHCTAEEFGHCSITRICSLL
ncbi:hypothetical protein JMUB7499_26740 [Staphylococcus aureus]